MRTLELRGQYTNAAAFDAVVVVQCRLRALLLKKRGFLRRDIGHHVRCTPRASGFTIGSLAPAMNWQQSPLLLHCALKTASALRLRLRLAHAVICCAMVPRLGTDGLGVLSWPLRCSWTDLTTAPPRPLVAVITAKLGEDRREVLYRILPNDARPVVGLGDRRPDVADSVPSRNVCCWGSNCRPQRHFRIAGT
jgi:hypothetical protein